MQDTRNLILGLPNFANLVCKLQNWRNRERWMKNEGNAQAITHFVLPEHKYVETRLVLAILHDSLCYYKLRQNLKNVDFRVYQWPGWRRRYSDSLRAGRSRGSNPGKGRDFPHPTGLTFTKRSGSFSKKRWAIWKRELKSVTALLA